jgi:hypothetical protein
MFKQLTIQEKIINDDEAEIGGNFNRLERIVR